MCVEMEDPEIPTPVNREESYIPCCTISLHTNEQSFIPIFDRRSMNIPINGPKREDSDQDGGEYRKHLPARKEVVPTGLEMF